MTLSRTQLAEFETTRRLLSCLVNEGLVYASVVHGTSFGVSTWLELRSLKKNIGGSATTSIRAATSPDTRLTWTGQPLKALVQPSDLAPPVVVVSHRNDDTNPAALREIVELNPAIIFETAGQWFLDNELESEVREQMANELRNSAQNQGPSLLNLITFSSTEAVKI